MGKFLILFIIMMLGTSCAEYAYFGHSGNAMYCGEVSKDSPGAIKVNNVEEYCDQKMDEYIEFSNYLNSVQ